MNQEEKSIPLRSVFWSGITTCSVFLFVFGFWYISHPHSFSSPAGAYEFKAGLIYWGVFSALLAVSLGAVIHQLVKKREILNLAVSVLDYDNSQSKIARECIKRELNQIKDLFEGMSSNVPGVIFRYEVPGFKQFGQFRYVSADLQSLAGYDSKRVLNDPTLFLNLIHKDDRRNFETSLRNAANLKQTWEHEFRLNMLGGNCKWIEVKARPNIEKDGPVCYDGIFLDVTEQKQVQKKIAEANETANRLNVKLQKEVARVNALMLDNEKSNADNEQVIRGVSHEVRTAVNGVQGMLDLLLESSLAPEQRQVAINARNSVQVLIPAVGDFIDHSFLQKGELKLDTVPFSPKETVEEAICMFCNEQEILNVSIKSCFDETIPKLLKGDQSRVRQVLYNLINNALKHSTEGTIDIDVNSTGRAGKYCFLRFTVRDNGADANTRLQQHILSGRDSEDSSNDEYDGLHLCRKLVELMGGKLVFESEENRGAEISFAIRLEDVSEEYLKATNIETEDGYQPLRVLVAEDVLVNQKICKYRLESLGHTVKIVGNGKQALEVLSKENFDAILMDCEMPIMDGYQATAAIRKGAHDIENDSIYIIAVTAKSLVGDREEAFKCGMNDYISKPFNQENISQALNRAHSYITKNGASFVIPFSNEKAPKVKFPRNTRDVSVGNPERTVSGSKLRSKFSSEEVSALLGITNNTQDS